MRTYFEEVSLDLPAVFAHLLPGGGVEQVPGGHAGVGHSLVAAQHPDEDVRDSVLRLCGEGPGLEGLALNAGLPPAFSRLERAPLVRKCLCSRPLGPLTSGQSNKLSAASSLERKLGHEWEVQVNPGSPTVCWAPGHAWPVTWCL